jgi:30S ribosome assembly GTPase
VTTDGTCLGCGAQLQSVREDEPGFLPNSALAKGQRLCKRCFRITHYGEFTRVNVTPLDYEREVSRVLDKPGIVLYMLDVFDLGGSLIPDLSKYISGSRVIVVVNKVDLLPKEVNIEAAKMWVKKTVAKTGISADEVLFVSAAKGQGFEQLILQLKAYGISPVYVVGMANVGKSTFLNRILQSFEMEPVFTVSRMPGTTLGLTTAGIPFAGNNLVTFVDTPGLLHGNRMIDMLCPNCLKRAVPGSRLRPRVFQLNPGQTLWIGSFARFDFVFGDRQSVVCYVSNELPIHRCKLEKADDIFERHADDILEIPCPDCRKQFDRFIAHEIRCGLRSGKSPRNASPAEFAPGRNGADFVIPGLGFITVFGQKLNGVLRVPDGVKVSMRRRLIGDISRTNA